MVTNNRLNMKKVLMQGNVAICEGAIAAGCEAYFGYPITPQNETSAHMSKRMRELNRVFLQAESELAAINMVLGAAVAGKRALTTSSSPGISLKQEGISYLAGCELPCVIANIQRGGPGLGNISGSQSDYFQATRGGGHGDYRIIVLAPSSVQEVYNLTYMAFDLADLYRTPVMVLLDGYLGQMMEGIDIDSINSYKNHKVNKDWALDGCKGREPRKIRSLFMGEGELEKHNWHLKEKYDKIISNEPRYEVHNIENSEIVIVAFGIAARICKGTIMLAKEKGLNIGLVRPITLWPFPYEIINKIAGKTKKIIVVEMNMGQMLEDVKLAVEGKCKVDFYGRPGGMIISEEEVLEKILSLK